ncbi:peptidase family M3 protein (macronuclear) [Tetrahymena thermophila SB210]|uniref:Peptidase family M3 protein n=1 Tax=Tetrahymena thermophila (strain SB210) TaxID=312017 RepID=I7LWE7_TETTS|nr:peptidase family M3 protein [Tetrahymena thermophila SB210]EAS01489.2 peptidase family M3 protein [Tetrahymena thermophila SB210]|eukprot:XP_001021735.2 peptidase family M3 protein [Tetrahymena thermophila SB210]
MKLLAKNNNVLNQVPIKLKLFKSSNLVKQKLTILNEISNDLCQIIDTSNILYYSKMYSQQKTIFKEIIEKIQHQFNYLNSDTQIYNQSLYMYYLEGQDYLDLDINDNQSPLGKQLVQKLQNQMKNGEKVNNLDDQDVQFLKMLINDYELRYFINKTENERERLQGLLMIEQLILQQLRASQAKNKKVLQIKREKTYSFEIFPDFYMGYFSSMNRSTDMISLDLPSQIQAQLLKLCSDPKLRSQIFNDFLETNKSNETLLNQLMEVRLQFANQLGFEDFQHYSLALNSKFFHFTRNTSLKQMLNSVNQQKQGFNIKDNSNNLNNDLINQTRDIKIIIQRILNASVERCHKRLETLLSDPLLYKSLQEKAKIKNTSEQQQCQLEYQDFLYLRQNILGTPSNNFTLTWQQAFNLLNQVSQRFLNVEFKECQAPKNHFFNRVCDNSKEELSNLSEVHSSDAFKQSGTQDQQQKNTQVDEKNIKCFELFLKEKNGNQKLKGVVFLDFNAYEDAKTCFSSGYCEINKYVQLPCLLVRMNFKVLDNKTEMTFDNFQTFMHEIGHSLHSVLNHHRYQLYANNFKIDYAEICAKVFENLIFLLPQNAAPKSSATSKEEQQKPDLSTEFIFQKPFQQYIEIFRIVSQLEQIYQAKLDLFLHEKHPENSITLKEFSSLIQKNIFKNLIPNNDNYWFCNLSHLEEYSGLYFSYAVGEEVFNELQDRNDSLQDQQQFIQNLFTSAHQ